MPGVHGLVYAIVGAVVLTMSLNLGPEFQLFIYAGGALLAYGFLKILWGVIQYRSIHKTMHKHAQRAHKELERKHPGYQQHLNPHHARQHHTQHQQRGHFCSRCGASIPQNANFCSHCGNRI